MPRLGSRLARHVQSANFIQTAHRPGGIPWLTASGHYIANSQLILQRKPAILRALRALSAAVMDPSGEVSLGMKRLFAYVVSRVHGCHY